jgi:MobA/MobL family
MHCLRQCARPTNLEEIAALASYHLCMKTVSRAEGRSATAAAAYRSGAQIDCEREGKSHDYSRKSGVLHGRILLPEGAPVWAADRAALWNAAEAAEKRKDAVVAREWE